jgi:hypothetical protein
MPVSSVDRPTETTGTDGIVRTQFTSAPAQYRDCTDRMICEFVMDGFQERSKGLIEA